MRETCERVQYELRGAPLIMYCCHCGTCRKATGTAFATNVIARADDLTIVAGADGLAAHRHYCSTCGSPIYSRGEKTWDVVSIRCGTLDDDPGLRPAVHAYVVAKAPWYEIGDDLPQKPESFA